MKSIWYNGEEITEADVWEPPAEAYCPECGELMEFVDDSFDHEFGTKTVHSWECINEDCRRFAG